MLRSGGCNGDNVEKIPGQFKAERVKVKIVFNYGTANPGAVSQDIVFLIAVAADIKKSDVFRKFIRVGKFFQQGTLLRIRYRRRRFFAFGALRNRNCG